MLRAGNFGQSVFNNGATTMETKLDTQRSQQRGH